MFVSLSTGRMLHRKQWKKLLISKKIINRVEELANKENQGYISSNFKYKWKGMNHDNDDNASIDTDGNNSKNEEKDELSVTSLNEFHDIADEVNQMINDEQHGEAIAIDSNSTNEDERSGEECSNNNDNDQSAIPGVVPSNDASVGEGYHREDTGPDVTVGLKGE